MCLYPQMIWLYPDPEDGHITSTMNRRVAQHNGGWKQEVPCGTCPECIYQKKQRRGVQAWCEAKTWRKNCFITLTYNDENMPDDYSIHWSAVQLFMARLRKRCKGDMTVVYKGKEGRPIRSFGCGEYGDLAMVIPGCICKLGRPHFHIILFNFDFDDKYYWRDEDGRPVYRSPLLESLWTFGISEIEEVGVGSCMYVAGYVDKKKHQKSAEHYCIVDRVTGEVKFEREPEQCHGSNRPGLGYFFLKKYRSDIVRDDFIMTSPGQKCNLPKYFDKLLALDEDYFLQFMLNKDNRKQKGLENKKDEDWLRILQREEYLYTLAKTRKTTKGIKL